MIALFIAAMSFAQGQRRNLTSTSQNNAGKTSISQNYIKGHSSKMRNTRALECANDAIFSTVDLDNISSAGTSNTNKSLKAIKVDGFSLPISSIRFFAAQMYHNGQSWEEVADVETLNFNIKIYNDDNNMPGTVIENFSNIELTHTATGDMLFDSYSIFQFDYTFATPVDVPSIFWLEISNTEENVWFMWLNNDRNDLYSGTYNITNDAWAVSNETYQICIVPQAPQNATVVAMPTSLSFDGIFGNEFEEKTISISTYNLTEDVTATTSAPFSVSSDGETFATTATISSNGGTLYVKYEPTEAGENDGTIVLTNTEISDVTINLSGTAIECNPIATFPFVETFEENSTSRPCWSQENDGDYVWTYEGGSAYGDVVSAHDGELNASIIGNGNGALSKIVSPVFDFSAAAIAYLNFYYANPTYYYYTDELSVYYRTSSTSEWTLIQQCPSAEDWTEITITLPSLSATYQFAFEGTDNYGNGIVIDDVTITAVTTPTIIADVNSIDFGSIPNNITSTRIANITAGLLTENIAISTEAPFEVSTDNETFGANATLPTNGGVLYVRFAPVASGTHTGTATLQSTGAEPLTITLTGNSTTCQDITEFPYEEEFENGLPACWIATDNDGDSHNWMNTSDMISPWEDPEEISYFVHGGNGSIASESYINYAPYGALEADNYLISPKFVIPSEGTAIMKFYTANIYSYEESFKVLLSTTGIDVADFTTTLVPDSTLDVSLDDGEWLEIRCNLQQFAGQSVYIAIVHTGIDGVGMLVDDFSIDIFTDPIIEASVNEIEFPTTIVGESSPATNVTIEAFNLTTEINVTTTAPFEVSLNNETFANTVNMPATGGSLYVRYNPTAEGNDEGTVSLTAEGAQTITIALSGSAIICNPIASIPYIQDFEDGITPCWTIISNNTANDVASGKMGIFAVNGNNVFRFSSYSSADDYNQYLITPELALTEDVVLTFDYAKSNNSDETFRVMASTTGRDIASFTNLGEDVTATSTEFTEYRVVIPATTKFIAINYFSSFKYYLYIDNFTLNVNTSVEENIAEAIAVYPNPTSDMVTIANAEGKDIVVINSLGQVVASIENAAANQTINVANFANGTYFVKVDGEVVKLNVVK